MWGQLLAVLERVMGIEPTFEAWEAPVLPLNYTRDMCLNYRDSHHCVTGLLRTSLYYGIQTGGGFGRFTIL